MTSSSRPPSSPRTTRTQRKRARERAARTNAPRHRFQKPSRHRVPPPADPTTSIVALPPKDYPSRNGTSSHHATMPPIPLPSAHDPEGVVHSSLPSSSASLYSELPLALAASGAGFLGVVVSTGMLLKGGVLFPHRIQALSAVLIATATWSLCSRGAPLLPKIRSRLARICAVGIFLFAIFFLLAAVHRTKEMLAYVNSGFNAFLILTVALTADGVLKVRHRRDLRYVAVLSWATLLGALSLATMLGGWDVGSAIIATGYGALCAAVALATDRPLTTKRSASTYRSLVFAGIVSLPALAVLSGQPPWYLVTYALLIPTFFHLRPLTPSTPFPSPYRSLSLAAWFLGCLIMLSIVNTYLSKQPQRENISGERATMPKASD